MGKLGHLSAKHGKASLHSNYSEKDFTDSLEDPTNTTLLVDIGYENRGAKRRRQPENESPESQESQTPSKCP
jgi:hypothetical protein